MLAAVVLASSSVALSAQTVPPIRLKARTFVPPANVRPPTARRPPAGTASASARLTGAAPTHLLVQFDGPVTAGDLAALRDRGATPLRYVPENTVAVSAAPGFDPSTVARVRWTGALTPPDKISLDSAADLERDRFVYPLTAIEFHPDVAPADVADRLLRAGVAPIPAAHLSPLVALIATDRTAIETLAADGAVAWIYPATTSSISTGALVCEGLLTPQGVVANYAAAGNGWDGPGANPVVLSYVLQHASGDAPGALQDGEIVRALYEWSRHASVEWRPAARPDEPRSVTMYWAAHRDHGDGFPFPRDVLAHAFYPAPPGVETLAGDVHFNDAVAWGVSDPSRYDIFTVALHEIGHALALTHSSNPESVMYPMYRGIVSGLGEEDIAVIRTVYAPAAAAALPDGWRAADIGGAVIGEAESHGETITIRASGRDVWDRADELRLVSRPLSGDGDVVARVDSLEAVHRWTKAGVMIRASDDERSAHAYLLVSGSRGLAFQRRTAPGGLSVSTDGGPGTAPRWFWLSRRGNLFTAYAAIDGGPWRLIGAQTIPMPVSVLAGLAVASHDPGRAATAAFSNVSIEAVPKWTGSDIGKVGRAGGWSDAGPGLMRVTGAGADIWGRADAFQFVWQPLSGDGEITARVDQLRHTHAWAKAGVMIRESLEPGSPHAYMLVSAGRGSAFQRRAQANGLSTHTDGGSGSAPEWIRLVRQGNLLTAYRSEDGASWTVVRTETIPMSRTVLAGLAVSSHVSTASCQAVFDNVRIR